MTKQEIASYLVNLNSIIEAQEKGSNARSQALSNEYIKHYDLLKQEIEKEKKDESQRR